MLCPRPRKKRSFAAENLAGDVRLVNRYNAGVGRQIAHSVLDKGKKYRAWSTMKLLRLAKAKGMSMEELYTDEFGVKPDGTDINQRQYGKLRNDLMPNIPKSRC